MPLSTRGTSSPRCGGRLRRLHSPSSDSQLAQPSTARRNKLPYCPSELWGCFFWSCRFSQYGVLLGSNRSQPSRASPCSRSPPTGAPRRGGLHWAERAGQPTIDAYSWVRSVERRAGLRHRPKVEGPHISPCSSATCGYRYPHERSRCPFGRRLLTHGR